MDNIGVQPAQQNLPPALRPGRLVRARGATWQVRAVTAGADCLAVELARHNVAARRQTLLYPFDRLVPVDALVRSKLVSRRRWIAALRGLLADSVDWAMPRAAVGARIDVLPYQLQPVLALLRGDASRLLIADEVGLGKTIEAGLVLAELCSRGLARRGLVVTPAGLRHQWLDELRQRFAMMSTLADAGWLARRTRELPAGVNPWTPAGCYVTSIDFVKQPEVLAAAREQRWDVLVVDEAHLAAPGTDRGMAVHELASRSLWVVLLSATPHDGNDERFAAFCGTGRVGKAGDPLLVFRRSRFAHASGLHAHRTRVLAVNPAAAETVVHTLLTRYAQRVWASADTAGGPGARLAMTVLLKRAFSSMHALERSARRRLQLLAAEPVGPAQQRLPLVPDTANDPSLQDDEEPDGVLAARGLADRAHERAWLGAIVEAAAVASRHERKLALVRRLLARTDEPLLLFTEFRDTLAWIARMIDRATRAELLHGGQTERERADAIAAFSSGRARVLLATDAASLGLNLQQRCRLVVNLEVPWNPNRVAQRVGRLARIGQQRRVHALMLVSRGTGEEQVLEVFETRRRSIQGSLDSMRSEPECDALAIGASILDREWGHTHDRTTGTDDASRVADPAPTFVRLAKSTFAADADRNAPLILARRHVDPASPVIAALARQRPWLTRLVLRVPLAHWLKSSPSGLVLARARLVDSCGHPWASTLVPLVFRVTRPAAFAKGPPWSQVLDESLATLEQDARRHVERWAALNRAAIQRFVHHLATRAGAIDESIRAEQRRSAVQPDLFVPASQPAAARPRDSDTGVGWLANAALMTIECEVVLGACLRARRPSVTRQSATAPAVMEGS